MNRRRSLVIITILSLFLLLLVEQSSATVSGGVTDRLSIATGGTQANNVSRDPAFSADGRYIAFQTTATNLGSTVPGGLIYIRDRNTRQTILVSVATDGKTGAGGSSRPAISADGRFVSFSSVSPNIVLSDTNGTGDIFVRDRQLNQTYRVSVATDGTQGNGESTLSAISADGRYVVFGSNASNLVLNDTNGCWDVFIRDLQTGVTSRVSVDSGASQANSSSTNPSISANGRFIIYESTASNLVTNDTNNSKDIFVYDKDTAQTSRVSLASDNSQTSSGESSSAVISGDGRYVTFYSTAANLVANDTNGLGDIFLRDRQTSQTARISVATDGSQANNVSEDPAISTDGRFIVFRSLAANLVPDDTNNVADVFLYDQQTLPLTRISVKIGGIQSNGAAAYRPALSPDGRYIAFTSAATDLVTGDTNSKEDIFLYDRTPATTTLVAPGIGTITKDTTPTFSWSSVTGVTKYQIQVDNNSDFSSPNLNPQVSTTTYTPGTGLANGPYWWHVKVQYVSGVWGDWSDTWTFTIDTVKPPLPILLLPATKSTELTSQPTFDWSDAAEAVRYDIQVDNNSDFSSPLFTNPAIPSQYTPDPGINDGVYYWRVRSVDAAGNVSSWTAGWNIRINAVPTPTPELNTPVEGGLTNKANPVFTWLAAVGVKSYRIQVDNEVTFATPLLTATTSNLTYTSSVALGSGVFYWHVQALALDGLWGSYSAPRSFTVDRVKPALPVLLLPATKSTELTSQPTFDWTTITDAVSYQLQLDNNSDFSSPLPTVSVDISQYLPDPGINDGVYYWRVRSVDAAGNVSSWTAGWNIRINAIPTPIPELNTPVEGGLTNKANPVFTWLAAVGVKSYRIQVDNEVTFATPLLTGTTSNLTYTSSVALGSGVFYWHVQALALDGLWGSYSAPRSFTVDRVKPALPVLLLPATKSTELTSQPTFHWTNILDAASYQLQLDNNSDFSSPLPVYLPLTSDYLLDPAVTDGVYYWRVRSVDAAGNMSSWTAGWNVRIDGVPTPVPVLSLPANNSYITINLPTLTWEAAVGVKSYQLMLDNNEDFSSPVVNKTLSGTSYLMTTTLPDGVYFWKVKTLALDGLWGDYSTSSKFTVDTLKPATPDLLLPDNRSTVATNQPVFDWADVSDAVEYDIRIDDTKNLSSPIVSERVTVSTYSLTTITLENTTYYWQVQSIDAAGNISVGGGSWSFTVAYTPAPITSTSSLTVEAESTIIQQAGAWATYTTDVASGGSYIYSSGGLEDAITMTFTGSRVDIIYVKHPALGVLVIEIDGSPVQLVDSAASESEFGARVTIALNPGTHTLRVYPMTGTIAVDAFIIEPQMVSVRPTVEPTTMATAEPTVIPTESLIEPTVEPTIELTIEPTILPTGTPLPVTLPFMEPFDGGSNWNAVGSWSFDAQTAYSGASWFGDSTQREQVSSLTYGSMVDLQMALYPQIAFWQKAVLTGSEVVTVEISLDGGQSWLPVDQQTGLVSDWALHTVDLTAYRGYVINLRFTLSAFGPVPDSVITVGYWLDELVIQDVPPTPTVTPVPTDVPSMTPLPTDIPTEVPTVVPTELPTETPIPTVIPTETPTEVLTEVPTIPAP